MLAEAAHIVAADQKRDGSWQLDSSQSLGSPATYGTTLATAAARRTIAVAAQNDLQPILARTDTWLRSATVETVIDAASVVFALEQADDAAAVSQRERALRTLKSGQSPSGGWGPYVNVAPQVFDTALALLALDELRSKPSLAASVFSSTQFAQAVARARTFLISQQNDDGSWPETTRPANQESYAQRISTTGWALLALLATAEP
jgi:squalene cyclase